MSVLKQYAITSESQLVPGKSYFVVAHFARFECNTAFWQATYRGSHFLFNNVIDPLENYTSTTEIAYNLLKRRDNENVYEDFVDRDFYYLPAGELYKSFQRDEVDCEANVVNTYYELSLDRFYIYENNNDTFKYFSNSYKLYAGEWP